MVPQRNQLCSTYSDLHSRIRNQPRVLVKITADNADTKPSEVSFTTIITLVVGPEFLSHDLNYATEQYYSNMSTGKVRIVGTDCWLYSVQG